MELNENAELDTSQVDDRAARGGGGGGGGGGIPIPIGGGRGGIIGLVITVLVALLGGGGGLVGNAMLGGERRPAGRQHRPRAAVRRPATRPAQRRATAATRSTSTRSRLLADRAAAERSARQYQPADTVFFQQPVNTGCGAGRPRRRPVLLPRRRPGLHRPDASTTSWPAGSAPRASSPSRTCSPTSTATTSRTCSAPRRRCAASSSATRPAERAARCGWSCRPTATPGSGPSTPPRPRTAGGAADLQVASPSRTSSEAIDAAEAVGDDTIQKSPAAASTRTQFTHGTSAQRQQWFTHRLRHAATRSRATPSPPTACKPRQSRKVIDDLAAAYREHAAPGQAAAMRAYMRDQFEFLGIPSPLRRQLSKPFLKAPAIPCRRRWPAGRCRSGSSSTSPATCWPGTRRR